MNATDALDHALGQLEGPDLEAYERRLAADPPAADTADRLERALERLLDDGETYEAPAGLAARTIAFVGQARNPRRTILDFVPVTVPFRWADVAVAAGVLLAGVATLLPAVNRSRARMEQAGCGYNLQQLGRALWQYGHHEKHFPFGPEKDPAAHTGTFAVMLNDHNLLGDPALLDCPCNGPCPKKAQPMPDFATTCTLAKSAPERLRDLLSRVEYAYNVGHQSPSGQVGPIQEISSPTLALLADQPDHDNVSVIKDGNSRNHGGRGQNVLYSDLHVGWHNTRRLSPLDADMFLNDDNRPAPGRHEQDTALLPAFLPFRGR